MIAQPVVAGNRVSVQVIQTLEDVPEETQSIWFYGSNEFGEEGLLGCRQLEQAQLRMRVPVVQTYPRGSAPGGFPIVSMRSAAKLPDGTEITSESAYIADLLLDSGADQRVQLSELPNTARDTW